MNVFKPAGAFDAATSAKSGDVEAECARWLKEAFDLDTDFEVDDALCEVRRAGVPIPLAPKEFDLLAYLVRNAERVVTKDELFARIWPRRPPPPQPSPSGGGSQARTV